VKGRGGGLGAAWRAVFFLARGRFSSMYMCVYYYYTTRLSPTLSVSAYLFIILVLVVVVVIYVYKSI